MIRNTGLIVLHSTRFGENSTVLHTLSKEYGRRSFLVRGVGKKALTTLFLPLTILEADIIENPKSNLYTAKNLSSVHSLIGIRSDIYKNSISMFIAEVLFRVLKEGTYEDGLYQWCEHSILLLDALESDFSNFPIRFLLEMAVVMGFSPSSEDMMPFAGNSFGLMNRFLTDSFSDSMLIPLSGEKRNELLSIVLKYLEYHIDSPININSLSVLRSIFA